MDSSPAVSSFKANASAALRDERLQSALTRLQTRFVAARADAAARFPNFEKLRDAAKDIKDHTLSHLDLYLEAFEQKVIEAGGKVHYARTGDDACASIIRICKERGARSLAKSKSMISEEIRLNEALAAAGVEVTETDLGEYIIQLRGEQPSHIVAPAIHLDRSQIEQNFRTAHILLDPQRLLDAPDLLMGEARAILREKFLSAEVGLTGANMLVAETGSAIIVTNEGNADLCQTMPKTHIVLASIEKVVPTLEDAGVVLRVLARSATGQDQTVYTTIATGPRRPGDPDGPEEFHVVLLDGGRSEMLGSPFGDMLRCIRCGACMNHCPVYQAIGGHAYGWTYPGPMGAVLTPALAGLESHSALPNASTFCGRCEEVCPVRIPLPRLMRDWRNREFERALTPKIARWGLAFWAYFVRRPAMYRLLANLVMPAIARMGRRAGRFSSLALARGWTQYRDLPAPQGATFQSLWRARRRDD